MKLYPISNEPNINTYLIEQGSVKDEKVILNTLNHFYGETIRLEKNSLGKPFIIHCGGRYPYSYSKSNQYQIFSFSKQSGIEIGIDIEFIQKRNFTFSRKFMSPDELSYYNDLNIELAKQTFFYRVFSMKEAIFKARGLGSLTDLSSICLLGEFSMLTKLKNHKITLQGISTHLFQDIKDDDYVISLAIMNVSGK